MSRIRAEGSGEGVMSFEEFFRRLNIEYDDCIEYVSDEEIARKSWYAGYKAAQEAAKEENK